MEVVEEEIMYLILCLCLVFYRTDFDQEPSALMEGANEDDDGEDEDEQDQMQTTNLASFRIIVTRQDMRDAMACFTRVMVAEQLCMDPNHSPSEGICASSLPWYLSDAARREAQAIKTAQEQAEKDELRAARTKGKRDGGKRREVRSYNG